MSKSKRIEQTAEEAKAWADSQAADVANLEGEGGDDGPVFNSATALLQNQERAEAELSDEETTTPTDAPLTFRSLYGLTEEGEKHFDFLMAIGIPIGRPVSETLVKMFAVGGVRDMAQQGQDVRREARARQAATKLKAQGRRY